MTAVEQQGNFRGSLIIGEHPWGALAHPQLARAHTLEGDAVKARAAYTNFLTLWKDADSDIPILKQAKTEYAKLQYLRVHSCVSFCLRVRVSDDRIGPQLFHGALEEDCRQRDGGDGKDRSRQSE